MVPVRKMPALFVRLYVICRWFGAAYWIGWAGLGDGLVVGTWTVGASAEALAQEWRICPSDRLASLPVGTGSFINGDGGNWQ